MTPVTAEVGRALDDLVSRYAMLVDRRDLDAAAALFLEDGALVVPDPPSFLDPVHTHEGRAAVRAALEEVADVPRTFHALAGQVYDAGPSEGSARGVVACSAHHLVARSSRDPLDVVWHLRYDDEYTRTAEGWRIARRSVRVDLVSSDPVRGWRPSHR